MLDEAKDVLDPSGCVVQFGGPDKSVGVLRDLLAEQIAAVPSGGSIDWVSYYFRDRRLAADLVSAHRRGVNVTVVMQAMPRTSYANDEVISILEGIGGIGPGLRTVSLPGVPAPSGRAWKPQLHEKVYCFSHPRPIAFIGSFNPSGDDPEAHPEVIREIGDQDRGHNVLVGLTDEAIVQACVNHIRLMRDTPPGLTYRFSHPRGLSCQSHDTVIHTWPRLTRHPIVGFLNGFGAGSLIRIAASHIRNPSSVRTMIGLARRGADLAILAEHTSRRVTKKTERTLLAEGVRFKRIQYPGQLPMHL